MTTVTAKSLAGGPLLTVGEVQGRLRCGRTYVYELLAEGALPSVRLGRRLIPATAVEQFLADRLAAGGLTFPGSPVGG